jgi:hypothetical protein
MARKSQDERRVSDDVQAKTDLETTHTENDLKHENTVVLKSSLDDLGLLATARKFWKVTISRPTTQTSFD